MAWMRSSSDGNLSYLCLGDTSLLVSRDTQIQKMKRYFQVPTKGLYSYISLSTCHYWYATLNSCKYLKSETHLQNAQVNKASSVNNEIVKVCLIVNMVRKSWSWIIFAGCGLHYFVSARFGSFESLQILLQPKALNICFSQLWKFIPWCV